uniref:Uncharacterized protein n=1 Tax=Florenciella sp. virus SA2 TaxID=3240092 RepID=A0AB39JC20_9VIRU
MVPFITIIERAEREKLNERKEKDLKSKSNINKEEIKMNKKNDVSPSLIVKDDKMSHKDKYENLVCLSNLEDIVVLPEKDKKQNFKSNMSLPPISKAKPQDFFDKYHDFFEP